VTVPVAERPAFGVAPSWTPSQVEDLGTVTTTTGDLVLIDFGLLRLWSGESAPRLDPDYVGADTAETANSAVDFVIVGEDPVAAGRAAPSRPARRSSPRAAKPRPAGRRTTPTTTSPA